MSGATFYFSNRCGSQMCFLCMVQTGGFREKHPMFRERARGFADNLWRNTSSLLDGLSKDMKIYMVCISNNLIYNYLYI